MDIIQAMARRHSVRQYTDRPLDESLIKTLKEKIAIINEKSGANFQLVANEPQAFSGFMAHYGKFSGVKNYIALVGPKNAQWEEQCGYWGENLVLEAQMLGLNSCWVAMSYSKVKTAFEVRGGEKLWAVIAIGYGENGGSGHRTKTPAEVSKSERPVPEWFSRGVKAALLAPTALNQQKFMFERNGSTVYAKAGMAFYSKMDLGIAKYHFEIGAGKENFSWG